MPNGDMTPSGLSQKADFAIADLTNNGGLLTVEQSNTFIQNVIDQPTILRDIRSVPMNSPSMELNKIGFGKRVLRAATSATALANAAVDGAFNASTEAAARAKPETSKVTLTTKEVIAEIRIPYEVLEDNIERGTMENTVLSLIAERAALDLEELLVQGDTAVVASDPYLGLHNGVLKQCTSHVVDAAGGPITALVFNSVMKALPTKYRRNRGLMRIYTPMDVEQDYRLAVSSRGSALGDAILTGTQPLPVFGVPLRGCATMPNSNLVFTNPQNIIFGIQRNVRVESERMISERIIKIVLTARVAIGIEQEDACVKVINLG